MAEWVGGALLNAFLNVLFDRMATPEFLDFLTARKIDRILLQKLKTYLKTINAVLYDAECKQIGLQDALVKDFLDDLRDAAYEADDLLDLIAYEVAAVEFRADQRATANNRPWKLSSLRKQLMEKASVNYRSGGVIIPGEIKKKIEDIVEIIQLLVQQIDPLGLKKSDKQYELPHREPTSHEVDQSDILDRESDKKAMVELLKVDGQNVIEVIPIIGMGGIGKTTLAQLVYNDSEVQELFATRAWVCVSDNYDGFRIKKELLQQVNILQKCEELTLQQIEEKLKESLANKKYLIVLDDMWDNDYNKWNKLQQPLKSGAPGSKIIVTTRIKEIASMMSAVRAHQLDLLSGESCWKLFAKHAFFNGDGDHSLQSFREDIIRKSGRLPLAAKMLGGVMRGKQVEEWDAILKSKIWEINCEVIPVLRLSYQYLPSHLKQCFAYCAIFPKDHKIRKEEIIQLWMAESFVVKPKRGEESLEILGERYLQELVSRSFLQEHNDQYDGSYFLMHDLINDLAEHVSGEFLIRIDDDNSCEFSARNRYFSFKITEENCSNILGSISKVQRLRTFWPFDHRGRVSWEEQEKIVDELCNRVLCLRVLSLQHFFFGEKLPKSIKHLKHLRYLNLANTNVRRLSNSVCLLYYLQTLILYNCHRLIELPKNIGSLINLHSLDLRKSWRLKKMPRGLGNLKDLRTLGKFIVGKRKGSNINELGELQHLCGKLEIYDLQNVAGISKDILKNKKHLQDLTLMWSLMSDNEDGLSKQQEMVLQRLQPNASIKNLSIFFYGGEELPDWLGSGVQSWTSLASLKICDCKSLICFPEGGISAPNMTHLELWDCPNLKSLPEGMNVLLSSLKDLKIFRCWNLESFPEGGSGVQSWTSLASLKISECWSLICFPKGGISAPNMTYLELSWCTNLKSLPEGMNVLLSSLKDLKIVGCRKLESFPEGGLPANLQSLEIWKCDELIRRRQQWGLQRLNGLLRLTLRDYEGYDLTSFPEESLFPSNLTSLEIYMFPNLEVINYKGLQHLASLSKLEIKYCSDLQSLPEEGLPSSLSYLYIWKCPLLEKRCEREKGEDWPKISHISKIEINYNLIQSLS